MDSQEWNPFDPKTYSSGSVNGKTPLDDLQNPEEFSKNNQGNLYYYNNEQRNTLRELQQTIQLKRNKVTAEICQKYNMNLTDMSEMYAQFARLVSMDAALTQLDTQLQAYRVTPEQPPENKESML